MVKKKTKKETLMELSFDATVETELSARGMIGSEASGAATVTKEIEFNAMVVFKGPVGA